MKAGPITLDYMRMQRQSIDRVTRSHAVPQLKLPKNLYEFL